nr:hypothetical protein [Ardenticatena sp.]
MTNLAAFDVDVNILGDVVRWQEGTLGDFLALTGRTVYTMGMQITESGATFPAAAYTTGDQSGVDGSGTLLTLDASVEAEGIGYLVFGRALFGTPNGDPIIVSREVDAVQVQSIHKGWNLVALCPDVSGQTISDVFRTIDGQYDALLDANQQTPTVLTGGSGVWVRGTNSVATRLTTLGVARDATASLALSPGWQLVAYCGEATLALDEALASIAGQYDRVIGLSGAYDPQVGAAYQTLTQLTPGDVILLHMTEQAFLRFPASGDAGQVVQNDCPAIAPTPYMSLLYGDVTWNGAPPSAGMRIEALNIDDEVVGCAATDDAGRFGLMTLYGRDEAAGIPGYAPNEPIRLRVGTCVVESTLLWQDDRTPHRVDIAGTDQGCEITVRENRTFLPFVVR